MGDEGGLPCSYVAFDEDEVMDCVCGARVPAVDLCRWFWCGVGGWRFASVVVGAALVFVFWLVAVPSGVLYLLLACCVGLRACFPWCGVSRYRC